MMPNDHSSTGASLSSTGSVASASCPACESTLARRAHRNGLTEKMLSVLYVYPFRCQRCGHRFRTLQWGTRYHRVSVDHREYHRHLVHIPVTLSSQHGEFHGKTTDLSIGGCTLVASGPFRGNSQWSVRLLLPSETHPVVVDNAVVRSVQNQQIGIEFLRAAPAEKERFRRFIEATWKQMASGFDGRLPRSSQGSRVAGMPVQPGQSPSLQ